jgi:2-amino-4-hydroxy-6-hydroxymethyldihydropteridine diphosphokinase
VAVSPVYETDPVGGPAEQDSFLNVVAELRTERSPHELLGVCHRLETAAERVRLERWGPRTLDVDVLDVDGTTSDDPELTLPHPRAAERAFVLVPWLDVDPEARIAGRGRVADLLAALPDAERDGVRPDPTAPVS